MRMSEESFRENWEWLVFLQNHTKKEDFKNPDGWENSIRKAKEKIRKYYRDIEENKDPYRRFVHQDEWGYVYERIDCPKEIKTKKKAKEFFNEYYRIPYEYYPWDCTGQWFTCHYTIGKAGDRYVISHCIACDM